MQKNKGITLVALVVTIVVLLILAGVSINLVLGENGLITQAKSAREQTKSAEANEKSQMDSASDWISETVNGTELPQTNETKPYMPSSEFKKVDGTNLGNGLVIEDADGNQYVWVEVPMTTTVYPTAGLDIIDFTAEEYTKIENDLHSYTSVYRNNTECEDEWSADTDNSDDWYTEEEYDETKQIMLKNIYKNGGFWIGRYEAGISESRTATGQEINEIPQSKENLYPYTYVTRTQAKKLVEKVQYGEYTGKIMFGVQWDLILSFFYNKGNISNELLTVDSKTIGNSSDSEFLINRGKYITESKFILDKTWKKYNKATDNYVDINFKKIKQNSAGYGVILTTGASDNNCLMNVYDIAGNIWEWTIEKSKDEKNTYVYRGSGYNREGRSTRASSRILADGGSGNFLGFRV